MPYYLIRSKEEVKAAITEAEIAAMMKECDAAATTNNNDNPFIVINKDPWTLMVGHNLI